MEKMSLEDANRIIKNLYNPYSKDLVAISTIICDLKDKIDTLMERLAPSENVSISELPVIETKVETTEVKRRGRPKVSKSE